jgi:diacylglycerol kinase family enzyme
MKIALVLNREAGTLRSLDADKTAEELAAIFREKGHDVSLHVEAGSATIGAIEKVGREKSAEVIVVGGGDGTVSAAAGVAAKSGLALGILPLGTMNFFARSLGIPAEMKAAAAALADGVLASADIGTVNGQTFVHSLALGLHPTMVAEREKLSYGSRYGKMLGSARAFARVIRDAKRFSVAIVTGGQTITARAAGVVVSNNPLGVGHPPWADRVDEGVLGVYLTSAKRWPEILRITLAAARGRVEEHPLVEHVRTPTATIHLGGRQRVKATLDGEIVPLRGSLTAEIVAGGLKVLKPREKAA